MLEPVSSPARRTGDFVSCCGAEQHGAHGKDLHRDSHHQDQARRRRKRASIGRILLTHSSGGRPVKTNTHRTRATYLMLARSFASDRTASKR